MMLQCPLPTDEVTAKPSFDFTFVWDKTGKAPSPQSGKMELSMCPNKHSGKEYKMVLCTTHQFGTRIQREDIVEWFEYHRLAGVDHVYWRERVGKGGGMGPQQSSMPMGVHADILAPYVAEGFATYIPGPYHPPFDWGSVYADQLYTNAACKYYKTLLVHEICVVTTDCSVPRGKFYLPFIFLSLAPSADHTARPRARVDVLQMHRRA